MRKVGIHYSRSANINDITGLARHCSLYDLTTAEPSGDHEDRIRETLSHLGRKLEEICFSCQCAFTFPSGSLPIRLLRWNI